MQSLASESLLQATSECACAIRRYAKIQISVRMPSDVRILHIYTEISICMTSVWLATLANYMVCVLCDRVCTLQPLSARTISCTVTYQTLLRV